MFALSAYFAKHLKHSLKCLVCAMTGEIQTKQMFKGKWRLEGMKSCSPGSVAEGNASTRAFGFIRAAVLLRKAVAPVTERSPLSKNALASS